MRDGLPLNSPRSVLWWSRSGRDYSRDRIIRQAFEQLGWTIRDFVPWISRVGDWQASLQRIETPDLVWVPCFRHRDAAAATRWAKARRVPIVFDPLISTYDKLVYERKRVAVDSVAARRQLARESTLMQHFDAVIADTICHADFYCSDLGLVLQKVSVIPVGAEPGLFTQQAVMPAHQTARVLFYGSFIGLQGSEIIAAAAQLVPEVNWTFIGDGPLKSRCQKMCLTLPNVRFLPWIPYDQLPTQIGEADLLLGIFGTSKKASRVIPNKVYQSLACGRVVITQVSHAYPTELLRSTVAESGLRFIPAGSAESLADAVRELTKNSADLIPWGHLARQSYERYFHPDSIVNSLNTLITRLLPERTEPSLR